LGRGSGRHDASQFIVLFLEWLGCRCFRGDKGE
jgi:hypothetical protein